MTETMDNLHWTGFAERARDVEHGAKVGPGSRTLGERQFVGRARHRALQERMWGAKVAAAAVAILIGWCRCWFVLIGQTDHAANNDRGHHERQPHDESTMIELHFLSVCLSSVWFE